MKAPGPFAGGFPYLVQWAQVLMMKKPLAPLLALAGGLILAGWVLLALSIHQRVTFLVDGQVYARQVNALTVGGALRAVGVTVGPGDEVTPPTSAWLWGHPGIRVDHAQTIAVSNGDQVTSVLTTERMAANVLEWAGVRLYPGDQVLLGSAPLAGSALLPAGAGLVQVRRAYPVTLTGQGAPPTFYSAAATLGQALWQAGVRLDPLDQLSLPLETPLDGPVSVSVVHPTQVQLTLDGKVIPFETTAQTVGQALWQAGVRLVGLDYSQPATSQPLPADGAIRVVRVRETVSLQQKDIPFQTVSQADPNTELDQRSVIQAGHTGLQVTRVRTRFEDGKQVSSQADGEWQAVAPQNRILGYGTKVVIHTTTVDGVTIQYYRAVTVYATSYSPCDSGTCSYATASGARLAKGIIGTSLAWFNLLRGQHVYVPGYGSGVIADYGYVGSHRIDLGYSESDYVGWHKNVTLYFLAPPPANIPWILP